MLLGKCHKGACSEINDHTQLSINYRKQSD